MAGLSDGIKLVAIWGLCFAGRNIIGITGFPYGHFGYSGHLGYKLFGYVPWTVVFAWTTLMLCAYVAREEPFLFMGRAHNLLTFLMGYFRSRLDPEQ